MRIGYMLKFILQRDGHFYDIEHFVQGKRCYHGKTIRNNAVKRNERSSSNKDEGLWDIFEIANLEMIERAQFCIQLV